MPKVLHRGLRPSAMRHLSVRAAFFAIGLAVMLSGCVSTGPLGGREQALVAGRTYVVLGASSGLGRGVAERLGDYRANVVVAARRADLIEEVAAETRRRGGRAIAVQTDAADPAQVERLASAAEASFGRIDVWVNMAGVAALGPFWEAPVEDHSRIVDTNLKGVIYGSHVALRRFRAQGHGVLVNMGSVESEVPIAYHASYAATKAGVLNLGRALNEELRLNGLRGVRVVTIQPWAVDTPFWQHAGNYTGKSPRMVLMDHPDIVVNALIRASIQPREEAPVGWKAQGAVWAHNLFPDTTERVAADVQQREFDRAPPAADTAGAIHRPVPEGHGVSGGNKARIEAEDSARQAR